MPRSSSLPASNLRPADRTRQRGLSPPPRRRAAAMTLGRRDGGLDGMDTAVSLVGVSKVYRSRSGAVTALQDVTVDLPAGTFTAVMGPSGSGKSTLLQCAAGLDRPTSGEVYLSGQPLGKLSETKLTLLRRERIGFVFQSFNLLPSLTAELNVALPLRLAGRRPSRQQV